MKNMKSSTVRLPFITKKIYLNKNIFLPTYPNFSWGVTGNKQFIFLGLIVVW